jgi:hypothetical protein
MARAGQSQGAGHKAPSATGRDEFPSLTARLHNSKRGPSHAPMYPIWTSRLSALSTSVPRALPSFVIPGCWRTNSGALFVANAAFNNLGYPVLSTVFNWGRASLGTIPFVTYGAYFGPVGLLVGQAAGSVIFGTLALITAFHVVGRLGSTDSRPGNATPVPSGTGNAALAALAVRPWHLPAHRRTQSTR